MEMTLLPEVSEPGPVVVSSRPTLVYAPHPILAQANRQAIAAEFFPGESIAAYLDRQGLCFGNQPVDLRLEGAHVPRAMWPHVRPKPGQMITIRAVMHGGGGGSNPIKTVLSVALMVMAPQLGLQLAGTFMGGEIAATTFLAGTTITGAMIGATVVGIGGNILLNSLFAAPKPNLSNAGGRSQSESTSPTYSLSGGSNRARPYEPMPLVFGTHRIFPDLDARPYTEYEGDDQYLYQIFNFGLSDIQLSDFRIGTTSIDSYSGITMEVSGADGKITLFPGNMDTAAGGSISSAAPLERTGSPNATALAVDIAGSLYTVGDSSVVSNSCTLKIEYQKVGDADWSPLVQGSETRYYDHYWSAGRYETDGDTTNWVQVTYGSTKAADHVEGAIYSTVPVYWMGIPTGSVNNVWRWRPYTELTKTTEFGTVRLTNDPAPAQAYQVLVPTVVLTNASSQPIRRTFKVAVPEVATYKVRVTKLTADSNSDRSVCNLTWSALRTYQTDTGDYTGQKRVALKIKASGQLNGQVEQFNALAQARVPVYNGSAWVMKVTSNPAWQFLWFARGMKIGARRYFGPCLDESRINLPALIDWADFCQQKGLEFNAVFDSSVSVAEVFSRISRMGRGSPSWATGKLGAIWDEGGQPSMYTFGMANIKRGSFQVEYATEKLADEVVATFVNKDKEWRQDQVRVLVPGVTDPQSTATIELFGCTSHELAAREANLQAAGHLYLRRRITWETDIEGLVVDRGDVVSLSHDLTQWGASGRIVACDGETVTLDREIDFAGRSQHWLGITWPNGRTYILRVVSGTGKTETLTLADSWPTDGAPISPAPLSIPDADPDHPPCDYRWCFDFKETPGKRVKIVGVQPLQGNDVRIVAQDEDDRYYAAEFNSYTYVTSSSSGSRTPTVSGFNISEELIRVGSGFGVSITLTINVSGPYELSVIRVGVNNAPLQEVGRTFGCRFTWLAPDIGNLRIEVTAISPRGEMGDGGRLTKSYSIKGKSIPPSSVAAFSISGTTLSWPAVSDVDLAGYRVRFNPGQDANWETAIPLHAGLLTGSPWAMSYWPSGPSTLLIKAVDTSGNESSIPAFIFTELGDKIIDNLVEEVDFVASAWVGSISGATIEAGTGALIADETSDFYPANDNLDFYPNDATASFYPDITYSEVEWVSNWVSFGPMPAGTVLVSKLQATSGAILYYRMDSDASFYPMDSSQEFYGPDDLEMYPSAGDWMVMPASMPIPDSPIQLRLVLPGGSIRGRAESLRLIADAPDRRFVFEDFSLAAGGSRVPLPSDVIRVKGVQITLQQDGGGAIAVKILDKLANPGPLLQGQTSAGVGVSATVDIELAAY